MSIVKADKSENDETLLIPNFIRLTKTRKHNGVYDMVKRFWHRRTSARLYDYKTHMSIRNWVH